jgi:hypothetical protein
MDKVAVADITKAEQVELQHTNPDIYKVRRAGVCLCCGLTCSCTSQISTKSRACVVHIECARVQVNNTNKSASREQAAAACLCLHVDLSITLCSNAVHVHVHSSTTTTCACSWGSCLHACVACTLTCPRLPLRPPLFVCVCLLCSDYVSCKLVNDSRPAAGSAIGYVFCVEYLLAQHKPQVVLCAPKGRVKGWQTCACSFYSRLA